jgi:hypothetical protein
MAKPSCSRGDKALKSLSAKSFHLIDLQKDDSLLTGLLRMSGQSGFFSIMIIMAEGEGVLRYTSATPVPTLTG